MTLRLATAEVVAAYIAGDPCRLAVLKTVRGLDLPDWAIGAGFVRNAVWDHLHGRQGATPVADVDVLYFDRNGAEPARDQELDARLSQLLPGVPWSVKNQARMHLRNRDVPYRDTTDAIRHWLETPTAIAVRLTDQDEPELLAPYGTADLLAMIVRPTPSGQRKPDQYRGRILAKRMVENWPRVAVIWPVAT
ncbi:MAG: nucleotidyltransferase family protein [Dongiaceae bacterium]